MIITNSLGSNYTGEDIKLSLSLLFQPWRWKFGKETDLLKNEIAASVLREGRDRNDVNIRLFYKGRQAIGETLRILKIGSGDEVIVQAFTCVAVVRPILEAGAIPVYTDVAPRLPASEAGSLNPPLSSIKVVVTRKTKAVILQHTLGYVNPENEKIILLCKQKGIAVIQDLAHALDAREFNKETPSGTGRSLLSRADAIIFSFSQDKVVDGVSGGGLVILNDLATSPLRLNDLNHLILVEIGKMLLYPICTFLVRSTYQFGIGRFGIGKGIHWLAKLIGLMDSPIEGSANPRAMPNALAALILQQFHRLKNISSHREKIALLYNELLTSKLKIVSRKEISEGANLRYPIWVNNRDELEEKLKKHGFYLVDHWYDGPVSPEWINPDEVGYRPGSCPNAEELVRHIFNLPTHVNISNEKAVQLAKLVNQYAKS